MSGSSGSAPRLVFAGSEEGEATNTYIEDIIKRTPLLRKRYKPPAVWGTNGHIQTAIFSIQTKRPGLDLSGLQSVRQFIVLSDRTTISYDVFSPFFNTTDRTSTEPITLVVCPGLANTSENLYIKAFALQASQSGYRVAVLNHLGVLEEELTTPRIFTLGSTEEYDAMVKDLLKSHPSTPLVAVGFSLGANIVTKYLGENKDHQKPFLCCLSLCQGYDFNRMQETMMTYAKLKKFYAKQLTNKVRATVVKNWDAIRDEIGRCAIEDNPLVDRLTTSSGHNSASSAESTQSDRSKSQPVASGATTKQEDANLKRVMKCKLMPQLDELVTIKLTGHATVEDYYRWASSCNYLDEIDLPTLFLNSKDDPLFSRSLLEYPHNKAKKHKQTLFVLTTHGGHLGFYTKTGRSRVDPVTWLERVMLEYIDAVVGLGPQRPTQDETSNNVEPVQSDLATDLPQAGSPYESKGSESADINANMRIAPHQPTNHKLYNMPANWSTSLLDDTFVEQEDTKPIRRAQTFTQPITGAETESLKRPNTGSHRAQKRETAV